GQPVTGAQWSSSNDSVIHVEEAAGVAVLTPRAAGTATLTATLGNLTASATISVYDAPQLPLNIPAWAVTSSPGAFLNRMFYVDDPNAASGPDIYYAEFNYATFTLLLRRLSLDGQQRWATAVNLNTLSQAASPSVSAKMAAV